MYYTRRQMSGTLAVRPQMGLSLKPPKWARNIIRGITGSVMTAGGTTVARDAGGQVTVTPPQPAPPSPFSQLPAGALPIGLGTLGLIAAGLLGLMLFKKAGRR